MNKQWRVVTLAAGTAVAVLAAQGALADPAPAAPSATSALEQEIAGIHRTLDRLVALLETVRDNQRVDLLLKRIELKERRLAPLENRWQSALDRIESLQSEATGVESRRAELEDTLNLEIRAGQDHPESDTRQMLQQLVAALKALEGQLAEARARARSLEDELAGSRKQIAALDEQLLKLLE